MGPLMKLIAERKVALAVAEKENIPFRKALSALRESQKVPVDSLAAASGFDEATCAGGLFSRDFVLASCAAAGVAIPVSVSSVQASGDGEFWKWLFSEEGSAAFWAFVMKAIEVFMMVLPMFL